MFFITSVSRLVLLQLCISYSCLDKLIPPEKPTTTQQASGFLYVVILSYNSPIISVNVFHVLRTQIFFQKLLLFVGLNPDLRIVFFTTCGVIVLILHLNSFRTLKGKGSTENNISTSKSWRDENS